MGVQTTIPTRWSPQRSTLLSSKSTRRSGSDISPTDSSVCLQHGENQRVSTTEFEDGLRARWSCHRLVLAQTKRLDTCLQVTRLSLSIIQKTSKFSSCTTEHMPPKSHPPFPQESESRSSRRRRRWVSRSPTARRRLPPSHELGDFLVLDYGSAGGIEYDGARPPGWMFAGFSLNRMTGLSFR